MTDVLNSDQIAAQILAAKNSIAATTASRYTEQYPQILERFGPQIIEKCKEDIAYHVDYLASAIRSGDADAFVQYILWVDSVLQARNANQGLIFALETMGQLIHAELGEEAWQFVVKPLDSAIKELSSETLEHKLYVLPPTSVLQQAYLNALLSGNRLVAKEHLMDAFRNGMSLGEIYVDVIQPVMYQVGYLWEKGKASVAQEHLATAITQTILSNIYSEVPLPDTGGKTALIACLEQNHHQIGPRMLADILQLKGVDTMFLGANTPIRDFCQMIDSMKPDIVGIPASLLTHIENVELSIERIRADFVTYRPIIMVGGIPFNLVDNLWKKVGGDVWGENAVIAVNRLL
jgi:methanogenic corrinoid protein MtbC1